VLVDSASATARWGWGSELERRSLVEGRRISSIPPV
jgi:hypothetical protein